MSRNMVFLLLITVPHSFLKYQRVFVCVCVCCSIEKRVDFEIHIQMQHHQGDKGSSEFNSVNVINSPQCTNLSYKVLTGNMLKQDKLTALAGCGSTSSWKTLIWQMWGTEQTPKHHTYMYFKCHHFLGQPVLGLDDPLG